MDKYMVLNASVTGFCMALWQDIWPPVSGFVFGFVIGFYLNQRFGKKEES